MIAAVKTNEQIAEEERYVRWGGEVGSVSKYEIGGRQRGQGALTGNGAYWAKSRAQDLVSYTMRSGSLSRVGGYRIRKVKEEGEARQRVGHEELAVCKMQDAKTEEGRAGKDKRRANDGGQLTAGRCDVPGLRASRVGGREKRKAKREGKTRNKARLHQDAPSPTVYSRPQVPDSARIWA